MIPLQIFAPGFKYLTEHISKCLAAKLTNIERTNDELLSSFMQEKSINLLLQGKNPNPITNGYFQQEGTKPTHSIFENKTKIKDVTKK